MDRLSKRRGAISVFLLLIFMVTYVFMGLLVDAGRYRMAQAYVENALDNASDSLLSNYNQLVFDLYGLFTVDMETTDQTKLKEQIEKKYSKYLDEALGIAKIDSSDYTTKLANLIFEDNDSTVLDATSLYDFKKTQLEAGTSITLADTANVENQIIEYMKFRAPVQLAGDLDGFLKKMNDLLSINDALDIAVEKNDIVDKYENPTTGETPLSEEAQALLTDIHTFAVKLYNFSVAPTNELPAVGVAVTKTGKTNPYKLENIALSFDKVVSDYFQQYLEACAEEESTEQINKYAQTFKSNCTGAKNTVMADARQIEANAAALSKEIEVLKGRVEATFGRYEQYIGEMEHKLEEKEGTKNYQMYAEQYEPTIEQAKAGGGELVKNLDILLSSAPYLARLEKGCPSYGNPAYKYKLSQFIEESMDNLIMQCVQDNLLVELERRVKATSYKSGIQSKDLYKEKYRESQGDKIVKEYFQNDLCTLFSHASYYLEGNTQVKDEEAAEKVKGNNVSESGKQDLSNSKFEGLTKVDNELMLQNPKWLDVTYSYTPASNDGTEVELETGEVEKGFISQVLDVGSNLLSGLGGLLEDARDNLYVDAYVMSSFSNYQEWKAWENGKNESKVKCLNVPYENEKISYNASYAAVEYIITGENAKLKDDGTASEGFGANSVKAMRVKLFGTRMLFNTLSILLDNGKIMQAQGLSAWAGPLAPLVTVVLLAAWAAMESVIDVMILMGDAPFETDDTEQGVLVYKGSRDWYFSAEGVVKQIATTALNTLESEILDQADELIGSLEAKTNAMIYDAYTSTQSTVDGIFDEIKAEGAQTVEAWGNELAQNVEKLPGVDSGSVQTLENQLGKATDVFKQVDTVKEQVDSGLLNAKEQATIAVSRASKEASERIRKGVNSMKKEAQVAVNSGIDKVIPTGNGSDAGSVVPKVRLTYAEYLYFYLFTMNQTQKVQRIQSIIQANMRVGGQKSFSMELSPVSVWADLECSMRFMFLSDEIVPESIKKNGRLRFKVIIAQSY